LLRRKDVPEELAVERTFGFIKPEGLADELILGEILEMIEDSGLKVERSIRTVATHRWLESHYYEHRNGDYYSDLINDIVDKEVMLLLMSGERAVERWRALMGDFREDKRSLPENAGTIRAKFMKPGMPGRTNFCHGAKTVEEAQKEYALANQLLLLDDLMIGR
jgi:nucleoside-diphosphate kinase